jgi:hypothetical protein
MRPVNHAPRRPEESAPATAAAKAPGQAEDPPWRPGTSSSADISSRQDAQIPCAIGGIDERSNKRAA